MKNNDVSVIHMTDDGLNYRDVHIEKQDPTGAEILATAGNCDPSAVLLRILPNGDMESINSDDTPKLAAGYNFIVSQNGRPFFVSVDESRFEWPTRHISGAVIRKLANIPEDQELLHCNGGKTETLAETYILDLGNPDAGNVVTGLHQWKLRIQGVTLTYTSPEVKVSDAMTEAGFDPSKAWNIFLMVAGQPKKAVDVNYVVDLRTPGIEKIRLMQCNVDNGDAQAVELRRDFDLLPVDETYLNGTRLRWETIVEGESRWLIIHDYPLLAGYTPVVSKLALNIPKNYPVAQIDMFYFAPAISRCDGVAIPRVQVTANIEGIVYQGWSRHRNQNGPWDPSTDNVATHLALVEYSLAREFGE